MKCECITLDKHSIYCERHKCSKTQRLVQLCQLGSENKQPGISYWKAWEENRGPGQNIPQKVLPQDILSKGKRYLNEREIWKKAGKPVRSDEEIFRIFTEVCSQCEHFNSKSEKLGNCRICGCFLKPKGLSFNKIAWSTTYCPANPPKWIAEITLEKEQQKELGQEIKLEQEMFQNQNEKQQNGLRMREVANHPVPVPKKKGGCGCGK